MEPATMSVDKKETQKVTKKKQNEEDNELITHGQSYNEEGVHGTQYEKDDSFNFNDNVGTEEAKLSRKLEEALCYKNWELAESLVTGSNMHILNEALCLSLDSIWFLSTREALDGLTNLIKKIISSGASNFSSAVVRTSFHASFVSACKSVTMSLEEIKTSVAQWVHECSEECSDTEIVETSNKVFKLMDWAMGWIEERSSDHPNIFTLSEVQFQLTAFKTFLDLTENQLTISDLNKAFDAACYSLNLYTCNCYPGWAYGTPSTAVRGLLNILAERGADNVGQCLLRSCSLGTTEVVRILLQIARLNTLPIDVDLALSSAACHSRFDTMKCLVDEGLATAFRDPLLTAARHGCIPVVSWFINRGCSSNDLCFALIYAASSNQFATATYLLPKVPLNVRTTVSTPILKITAARENGSLDGVAFLLSANFVGSPNATYNAVEMLISQHDERVPQLTAYLKKDWSQASFYEGMRDADDHYLNVVRVLRRGCSKIQLKKLPIEMVIAIALAPLYRECLKVKGELLPQRLRGELVASLNRLGCHEAVEGSSKGELMTMLERYLPSFSLFR